MEKKFNSDWGSVVACYRCDQCICSIMVVLNHSMTSTWANYDVSPYFRV